MVSAKLSRASICLDFSRLLSLESRLDIKNKALLRFNVRIFESSGKSFPNSEKSDKKFSLATIEFSKSSLFLISTVPKR